MSALAAALETDGLALLALGVVLAGLVRGFTGFGTALVYLPFAAQVLPPVWTVVTLTVIDLIGPLPAVPRALREGHGSDVLRLGAGAVLGVPLGVLVLTALPAEPFRYGVSALALLLVACLVSGLRYTRPVGRGPLYGIGSLAGLLGGALGLGGPPVILLYMARPLPPAVIRASTLLFLMLLDVLILAVLGGRGLLAPEPLALGLCLALPYLAGVVAGSAVFNPDRERVYRGISYGIIAAAALSGLPLFD